MKENETVRSQTRTARGEVGDVSVRRRSCRLTILCARRGEVFAALCLAALLVVSLPLFFCMPLWCDVTYFDICARTILRGRLLYHDVFFHNLPGRALLQAAIRACLGWRSETVRGVDVMVIACVVYILVCLIKPHPRTGLGRLWTAFALLGYYLTTWEACHAQPDSWMLLPALCALLLLQRQVASWHALPAPTATVAVRGFGEGICWGLAVVIKPFVVVPAAGCWLVAAALLPLMRADARRQMALAAAAVFTGGLFVGGATWAWLWMSRDWPFFVEANLGSWNQDYFRLSSSWGERSQQMLARMRPWSVVHLAAVPIALGLIIGAVRARRQTEQESRWRGPDALAAAFYLGWLFQANFLQRQFDYHLVPTIMLALALVASQADLLKYRFVRYSVLPALMTWWVLQQPVLLGAHLEGWAFLVACAITCFFTHDTASRTTTDALIEPFVASGLVYLWSVESPHHNWVLLFSMGALWLRRRQVAALLRAGKMPMVAALCGLAEGVCWGTVALRQPSILLAALACWLLSATVLWRTRCRQLSRRLALDLVCLGVGVLIAGASAEAWLSVTGERYSLIEANLAQWDALSLNSFAALRDYWPLALKQVGPFGLAVDLAAVVVALCIIGAMVLRPQHRVGAGRRLRDAIAAGFFLCWVLPAVLVQRQPAYQLATGVLFAFALLMAQSRFMSHWIAACGALATRVLAPANVARFVVPGALVCVVAVQPFFRPSRLALWSVCWQGGSTVALRDRLALSESDHWVELEQVGNYLRDKRVRDRELTCYSLASLPLYLDLDVEPSTRFVMLGVWLQFFPTKRQLLLEELAASPQRYLIAGRTDFLPRLHPGEDPRQGIALHEIVFRTAYFVVYRVGGTPERTSDPGTARSMFGPRPHSHRRSWLERASGG